MPGPGLHRAYLRPQAGVFFGGSGGWEGIASSAYEINHAVRISLLTNTTGFDVNLDTIRSQLYRELGDLP